MSDEIPDTIPDAIPTVPAAAASPIADPLTGARLDTPASTPLRDTVLAFGPMALLPLLAAAAWGGVPLAAPAGQLWAAVLLIFLAGAARGLSFFTVGGPRISQVAATIVRFLLGLAGLVLPPDYAFAALVAGYASVALYDLSAARSGAAPRYFARLRPPQMVVALVGLVGLWVFVLG